MLKAKIYMDLFTFDIKIVAEYPDLIEENNNLYKTNDELKVKEDRS
jgi:hypothetical protein